MKRIIASGITIIGILLFIIGRFVIQNNAISDNMIRSGGVLMIIGVFFTAFFWNKRK